MPRKLLLVLESILVGMPWVSAGCSQKSPEHKGRPITVSEIRKQGSEPEADTVVLEGTLIRKGWSKTGESWNAGGSHYYVLDVGSAVISHRNAKEGVILRPSDSVPFDDFERFKDHRVAVVGRFVEGKPWTPGGVEVEQHPMPVTTPVAGEIIPVRRGSGFQVFEIIRLDEKAP